MQGILKFREVLFQLDNSYFKPLMVWSLFAAMVLPTQKAFSEKKMIPISKKALQKAEGVLAPLPKVRWSAVLPMEGIFPKVAGSNLNKQAFSLPNSFTGELNLVMVAFQRQQQDSVNTWLPLAQQLEREYGQRLHYYELPTISRFYGLFRGFIDGGMRSGIPNLKARARTVTLYIDKVPFRKALSIPTEQMIQTFLLDRKGRIFWRTSGSLTAQKQAALFLVLDKMLGKKAIPSKEEKNNKKG